MEVDEGDLTTICEGLTLDSPKNVVGTPVTAIPSHPVTPLPETSFFQQFPIHQQTPQHGAIIKIPQPSMLTRMLRSLAQIDDETMRRIAMLPYMVSGYFQLMFNIALPTFFLYWVYSFGLTIQSDVEKKVLLFSEEVMEQIAKCSRDYRENRCDPSTRVPALISACQAWEECMTRDPHLVAKRSGISAEIFGETLNSFFNVLSWKSIVSLVLLVIGIVALFNLTFSMTRKPGNREDSPEMDPDHRIRKSPRRTPAQLMNTPRRRRY